MTILTEQGTIIVLGAGSRPLHEARLRRLGYRPEHAVILNPGLGPRDRGQTGWLISGSDGTTLLDGWIASKPGEAQVTRWGAAGLQGLGRPSAALRQLFPNLLDLGRRTVRLMTLDALLAELAPLPDPLSFWIDMPGSEAEILSLVLGSNARDRLGHLWLRSGAESWFEGAPDSAALERIGAEGGLTLAGRDLGDPDFPDLLFSAPGHSMAEGAGAEMRLSAKARLEQIAILEARIVDLGADNDALRAKAEDQAGMIASLEAVMAKAVANASEASAALASLRAEAEQVAAERDAALNERQILEARLSDLEQENGALRAKADDQADLIETLEAGQAANARPDGGAAVQDQLSQLAAERDAALDRLAAMTERNETLSRQHDMARDELRRAEGQVALIRDLLLRDAG